MIQRKQSLFLLLAAIVMFVMYRVPMATFMSNGLVYKLFACHILQPENGTALINVMPMAVLPLLSAILSVIAIFKFKNRTLQMRIGKINYLVLITLIAVQVIYVLRIQGMLNDELQFGFSGIVPVVAIILVFMANKAIKKDDDLVKSADRIR